MESVAQFKWR